MLYKFTFPNFQPLPKPRMVRGSNWWAHKKYWDYFNYLKDSIREKSVCKGCGGKPNMLTQDLGLKVKAFRQGRRRADASNILKGIEDAIEKSGIIKNDNQFVYIQTEVFYGNEEPSLEIEIFNKA